MSAAFVPIPELDAFEAKLPKEPVVPGDDCPDCDGQGSVELECVCDECGYEHERTEDCEECKGTGKVQPEPEPVLDELRPILSLEKGKLVPVPTLDEWIAEHVGAAL
jgi:hypothetical protein